MRGLRRRSAGRAHRRSAWTRGDSLALTAITLVAAGARAFRLTQPARGVFDEVYYVRDGCFYLRLSACRPGEELSPSHPPLGKWLIGVSIRIFGYRPGGWRVAPLVAGILTVALLYILARKLLGSTTGASIAAGLLAIDFLHLVQSRTAMLDVFVPLFVVAAFLCSVYDRERWLRADPASSGHRQRRLFDRRWRFLAGLAMGAAVSSKWSGLPILPALIALILSWEVAHRRARGSVAPGREALREEVPSVLLALLVIPAAVYLTSYVGVVHGSVLAFPWSEGSWARAVVDRQVSMVRFPAGVTKKSLRWETPLYGGRVSCRCSSWAFRGSGVARMPGPRGSSSWAPSPRGLHGLPCLLPEGTCSCSISSRPCPSCAWLTPGFRSSCGAVGWDGVWSRDSPRHPWPRSRSSTRSSQECPSHLVHGRRGSCSPIAGSSRPSLRRVFPAGLLPRAGAGCSHQLGGTPRAAPRRALNQAHKAGPAFMKTQRGRQA